jgi:hypothetical protein
MPRVLVSAFLHAVQAAWPFKSRQCGEILGRLVILANVPAFICRTTVPATGITPAPVVMGNLPLISNLSAYVYANNGARYSAGRLLRD